tara:strand:- start:565 stop:1125 length:561 start_codon:yes stop_codon:yes gene_type:complete
MKIKILLISFLFAPIISFSQDLFIYKDGSELKVKVLRVNEFDVNYKKQSNLNGPEYTETISNLFMIKYKNGSKDIFNNQRNNKTSSNEIAKPNVNACSHENDTLEFVNNKFLIKCKECDAIIRFATSKEVKNNKSSSNGLLQQNGLGCGDRPEAPAKFNNPQYKQTKAYRKYKKELIEWKNCTGND